MNLTEAMREAGAIYPPHFVVDRSLSGRCYQLWITASGPPTGKFFVVTNIEIEEARIEATAASPAADLTEDQAQRLLDSLWEAGLRPRDELQRQGALEATQHHLSDMRKIALDSVALYNGAQLRLLSKPPIVDGGPE